MDPYTKHLLRLTLRGRQRAIRDHDAGRTRSPLKCGFCLELPYEPITAPCGHTSCKACLIGERRCFCGAVLPGNMSINILVQKLLRILEHPLPSRAPPARVPRTRTATNIAIIQLPELKPSRYVHWIPLAPAIVSSVVARRWVEDHELDCHLCTQEYFRPVTTPCGHTFCRGCLDRALDHQSVCPMCKSPLRWFEMDQIKETQFVKETLKFAGILYMPLDDDRLPIIESDNAFPMVSCPLFLFEPRYRLMLRRVLRKDRVFGMCHPRLDCEQGTQIGTKLEIRDCVRLPNGSSLVSTMGMGRFRIRELAARDGYLVAKIYKVYDTRECGADFFVQRLKRLLQAWRRTLSYEENFDIDLTYGPMPPSTWYSKDDGSAFVWWAIAQLPVDCHIKLYLLRSVSACERVVALEQLLIGLLNIYDRRSRSNMDQMRRTPPMSF